MNYIEMTDAELIACKNKYHSILDSAYNQIAQIAEQQALRAEALSIQRAIRLAPPLLRVIK